MERLSLLQPRRADRDRASAFHPGPPSARAPALTLAPGQRGLTRGLADRQHRTTVDVLYLDEHIVAVHKPSGLAVHRNAHIPRAPVALQCVRDQIGRHVFPVHRLDAGTSGILVFALTAAAAEGLSSQFRAHAVGKLYAAVVRGYTEEAGVIGKPLRGRKGGAEKPACTAYERLATAELPVPVGPHATARYSLVEAKPSTGRRHQIRRHFEHISHPVIGDSTHGDGAHNALFRERFGLQRLLLTAVCLEFRHPETGREVRLETGFDPEQAGLFARLGWGSHIRRYARHVQR